MLKIDTFSSDQLLAATTALIRSPDALFFQRVILFVPAVYSPEMPSDSSGDRPGQPTQVLTVC